MHFNALHLPLFLTFGAEQSDSIWQAHAEDLYDVMVTFADTVLLHESSLYGHGWSCAEEELICDFFDNFSLNRYPLQIAVNADEEGHWYWANILMRHPIESFARFEGLADTATGQLDFAMLRNVESASFNLLSLGFPLNENQFTCQWDILDGSPAQLVFQGVTQSPISVLKNGLAYPQWTYDPMREELILDGEGGGLYEIIFQSESVPPVQLAPYQGPILSAWRGPGEGLTYYLATPGVLSWQLYDLQGRKVKAENLGWRAAGTGKVFIADQLSSGVYFLALKLEGNSPTRVIQRVFIRR